MVGMKTLCISLDTIKKMKVQVTDWERIFVNDMSDKGLEATVFFKKILIIK